MIDRHQVFAAVLGPLHRPADMPRRERDEKILRIELAARAEAAADVVLDHVDGDPRTVPSAWRGCGDWRTAPWRRPTPSAGRRAASHSASTPRGSMGSAVWRCVRKALAPRIGRIRECRVGVAESGAKFHRNIAAFVFKEQRFVFQRGLPIRDRRQRLDIDLDRPERVLGDSKQCRPAPSRSPRRHSGPCHAPSPAAQTARTPASAAAASGQPGCGRPNPRP